MVELRMVQNKDKKLLYNLMQKYLYEMSNYYDNDIDVEGNYSYRYFEDYFTDYTRKAILILKDKEIAGFMLLNSHSYIGGNPDNVIAEFSILPKYRKCHIAKIAVEKLFHNYPGTWEIKYNVQNTPAVVLSKS